MWLVVVGCLLALFFILDSRIPRTGNAPGQTPEPFSVRVRGTTGLVCLALMIAGVFVAPLLDRFFAIKEALWAGAIFQIAVATFAYLNAPRDIHAANDFNFGPVKEVGLLFAGIFATMAPALAYLQANGSALGLTTPTHFYFATGVLSATLDNAPTYLSFLQVAFSVLGLELNPANLQRFIDHTFIIGTGPDAKTVVGAIELEAISLAAVFFGAMTYIGNGPNFMVKAIAEARGLKMPSFFGYVGYATLFLFPILVLNWFVFIR
jgi:Na+/H+ antiporter NhaD/arsenite permease-like protein